ncbi:MAG: transcription termination/antitermination protein NusA [Alphaproteobacteria bacterium]|nr:MAG: transcription termination/antitermination protein NusA [Alphaproteobacteria bacterium]
MIMNVSHTNDRLVDSIFALAQEKSLGVQEVLKAAENVIAQVVSKSRGGMITKVDINPSSGSIDVYNIKVLDQEQDTDLESDVVREIAKSVASMDLASLPAHKLSSELVASGDLASLLATRQLASEFRRLFSQEITLLEKEREYTSFFDREGTLIVAKVKRFERGNIILDLKISEGLLANTEIIPEEHFRIGQEIKCYIYKVQRNAKDYQILLSRKRNEFLELLFAESIPEINSKIFIKKIAREAGSRSKVAVISIDPEIDPIGSCIGKGGMRIKSITRELGNEKIDVIHWSDDKIELLINAIHPAEVVKAIIKSENDIELVIKDDCIHQAIGRSGQHARLARKLAECNLKLSSETEYKLEKERIASIAHEQFSQLNLSSEIITLFIENDITSLDVLKDVYPEELVEIDELNLSLEEVTNLISQAKNLYMQLYTKIAKEVGSSIDTSIDARIYLYDLKKLAENNILTNEDIANCNASTLVSILNRLHKDEAIEIINNFKNAINTEVQTN